MKGTSLEGRVAFVTGGGRGIGRAVAMGLAAQGATVVVNDLGVSLEGADPNAGPASEVAGEIAQAGGTARPSTVDVTDFDAIGAEFESIVEEHGSLDIVVNVAGILRDRMIFNMSEEEWDAVVAVHMKGTFNTARHAAAYWRSRRDPAANFRLINFTSGSGLYGAPAHANYASAKMGIVGLTYSCANGLARYGVTANAVAPVATTRMSPDRPAEEIDPLRTPENVAPLVLWLASPASNWCTGQVFEANGHRISLFSRPAPVAEVEAGEDGWDLDQLTKDAEAQFAEIVRVPVGPWAVPAPSEQVAAS